jgi:hypothetical protein
MAQDLVMMMGARRQAAWVSASKAQMNARVDKRKAKLMKP